MPLIPPIDFPHPINDDPGRAHARMLAWGRRLGLDADPTTWRRFLGAGSDRLIVYAYPEAHGADLELAVDMMCLFFIIDEVFDGPLRGDPGRAAAYIEDVLSVLDPDSAQRAPLPPITAAFAELWTKSTQGMSHHWRVRAAANWIGYFWANLAEDIDRAHHPLASLADYLKARRDAIGYRPCQDMMERAARYELPARVRHQTAFRELSDIATDLITLCNDVFSLEKEQDRGDSVNSVLLLARTTGATTEDALEQVVVLNKRLAERFHQTAERVREFGDHLQLTATERARAERWIQNNHTWIGAQCDWAREISRYAAGADPVHPSDDHLLSLMYA